ncbi:winged helix-turn-helix transcriptional regulator [Candidatus Gottesmanbacteria bacterium]|nr:winged helix-turn-helix transcriptional regulator [Candidatus Gottesmanbacteria bacterium]
MTRLPLSEKSLDLIGEKIFAPLRDWKCAACLFVPGGGKRTLISYFLSHQNKIKKYISGKTKRKILLVYVNPDKIEEFSSIGYLKLLVNSLSVVVNSKEFKLKDIDVSKNILDQLQISLQLLVDRKLSIVFILQDFELILGLPDSIFQNLESIMSVDKSRITFILLASVNLFSNKVIHKFHNLKYAVTESVNYIKLLDRVDSYYVIDVFGKILHVDFPKRIKEEIFVLSGGNPQLMKYSIHILKNIGGIEKLSLKTIKGTLLKNKQIRLICNDIWNALDDKEKLLCIHVVRNRKILSSFYEEGEYLLSTGLISLRGEYTTISGELFHDFLESFVPKEKLICDPLTQQIFFGTSHCSDVFTPQEFKVLIFMLNHEGVVISRDEVGEVLWGKGYYEKYSEWMIDKIISTLRKKLDSLGSPSSALITLKKRGFYFKQ